MLNSPSQLELQNLNLRMSQKSSRVFKQSGVIPYRLEMENQFLLITNRRCQHWLIPKGGIKSDGLGRFCSKEAWKRQVLGQVDANKINLRVSQTGEDLPGRGVFVAGRNGSESQAKQAQERGSG